MKVNVSRALWFAFAIALVGADSGQGHAQLDIGVLIGELRECTQQSAFYYAHSTENADVVALTAVASCLDQRNAILDFFYASNRDVLHAYEKMHVITQAMQMEVMPAIVELRMSSSLDDMPQ